MRNIRPLFHLLIVVLICASAASAARADEIPQWLATAARGGVPTYAPDVPAVMLHEERSSELGADGRFITTQRRAVKILTREGRGYAVARVFYLASSEKVRDLQGWLIRPDGTAKAYDKKAIVDMISDDEDVYNEGRVKMISGTDDVEVGSVFAFSAVTEETPLFFQDRFEFQYRLPAIRSRYSLTLPAGWTATSKSFNTAELAPQVNGTSYVWEMRDLQPIPPEPMSPSVINLSPRIVVNFSSGDQSGGRSFTTWNDVSRWGSGLHDPAVVVDDAVAGKARDLTANAKTDIERIRAIGTFVQNLQYISIDIGVGLGNGYRPRPSTTVLTRGYGDCKDKANLMRALLRSLKIDSYPVFIFSGDPTFVREQWPSPRQFNHCIIAIKVGPDVKAQAVMEHPKLGRLLIFDATDPFTAVGDLPDHLQGSNALIAAGEAGDLAVMPVSAPEVDLLERTVNVVMGEDGTISGKISETMSGQSSASARRETRELAAPQFRRMIEGWLTRGSTAAQLADLSFKDDLAESRFNMLVDFRAPMYGQLMQNKLLVFKPVVVGRRESTSLTSGTRSSPVQIDSAMVKETASFALPAGFVVDEMPDPVTIESEFGRYATTYEVKGDKLLFSRVLRTTRATVPAAKYGSVRAFYARIQEAEQAPVVLIRK